MTSKYTDAKHVTKISYCRFKCSLTYILLDQNVRKKLVRSKQNKNKNKQKFFIS